MVSGGYLVGTQIFYLQHQCHTFPAHFHPGCESAGQLRGDFSLFPRGRTSKRWGVKHLMTERLGPMLMLNLAGLRGNMLAMELEREQLISLLGRTNLP